MIYFFQPDLNNPYNWRIAFVHFTTLIIKCLDDNNIPCQIIEKNLEKISIQPQDFLIIFQINFPGYIYSHSIGGNDEFWDRIGKQVILIVSEAMNVERNLSLIEQIKHPKIHSVWDYSEVNMKLYDKPAYCVPNGYHKCLEMIEPYTIKDSLTSVMATNKPIDVLFYGSWLPRRQKIFKKLQEEGFKVVMGQFYLPEMQRLLRLTKIVPIIFAYDNDKCVDFYRLMPLLPNRIFTIHEEPSKDYKKTKEKFNELIFVPYDELANKIIFYLRMSQIQRDKIVLKQYRWWKEEHHINKCIPLHVLKQSPDKNIER